MIEVRKRKASKITAILLALLIAVAFMPSMAFAAKKAEAKDITVYLTVSMEQNIASTKDNDAMAWARVTVKDEDGDGKATFDEILVAAHDMYYEGGAAAGYDREGTWVKKLWGDNSGNYMFFINDKNVQTGVNVDTVQNDDELIAALVTDTASWSDWVTRMGGADVVTCGVGDTIDLKLTGRPMFNEGEYTPVEGATIGTWTPSNPFLPVKDWEGNIVKTDKNGEASGIAFIEPGFYILTAQQQDTGKTPIIAPVGLVMVKKVSKMTVKANKLQAKSKKKTVFQPSQAFKVKNNVGTVNYTQKTKNSKITVSKKGKVTVKRGLKKGKTYKIKVTVQDTGTEDILPKTTTVTLKVKVK